MREFTPVENSDSRSLKQESERVSSWSPQKPNIKVPQPWREQLEKQVVKKAKKMTVEPTQEVRGTGLVLHIKGQIRGGKNSVQTTKTGHRYPNKMWAKWRDEAVKSVKAQLPAYFETINVHQPVRLTYLAGDKRRRDQPAIIDAVWHVLEKAGVISDDTLLWATESTRGYDKDNAGATIKFL
jgi:Holliday junction resolvase RusA-like endonuclease